MRDVSAFESFLTAKQARMLTMTQVYAEHYDRLLELKKKYDPKNRLKGPMRM